MNLLITGATGYVGSAVVPHLLEAGHTLRALVRNRSKGPVSEHDRCRYVEGDVLNLRDLERAIDGCQGVVHLVGIRRKEMKRTGLDYADVDTRSVETVTSVMRQHGVERILLLSAGAIGKSNYVRCKAEAERIVVEGDFNYTIYRPSFIVGPRQQWPRAMAPLLWLIGKMPGHIGDLGRRAGNVTREELARSICWGVESSDSSRKILDVPMIRSTARIYGI